MRTNLSRRIKHHSFLLVAHYATFAYQDLLYEYLTKRRAKLVTKINFPLPELPLLKQIELYQKINGQKEEFKCMRSLFAPPSFAYFLQAFQYVWIVGTSPQTYDYVIAEDSLLAFCSILLRALGKCKHVIFYSHGIDFTRFGNQLTNWIYQRLDKFSAQKSNYNWFLSQNMIPIRKTQGIDESRMFWVPSSIPIANLPRIKRVASHTLVFLGVINDKNGVGILPEIINEVRKKVPDVRLDIMGEGDMKQELQKKVKILGLTHHVRFLGNVEFQEFKDLLTYYRAGVVTYKYSTVNLIPTSDSMKMRVYLAAGLPVVITKGFIFSDEVEKNHLGFAVRYDAKEFAEKLMEILINNTLSKNLRACALAYSQKMDLTKIYNRTFTKIFSQS